jgi:predicted hotdog family 3-hydroxylacyl-ACP dehydratase
MNPSLYHITDLIPQRPPMQMIDRLLTAGERTATGSLFITDSNMFVENGWLSESALIEFIAQTAAAYTGYVNKINNSGVSEGYIGAVKNFTVNALPAVNTEIQSEIEIVNEIVGFTIILGRVFHEGNIIAECEMRILSRG